MWESYNKSYSERNSETYSGEKFGENFSTAKATVHENTMAWEGYGSIGSFSSESAMAAR